MLTIVIRYSLRYLYSGSREIALSLLNFYDYALYNKCFEINKKKCHTPPFVENCGRRTTSQI